MKKKNDKYEAKFSLSRHILGVNIIAIVVLAIGFLYLEQYQKRMIFKEKKTLLTEAVLVGEIVREKKLFREAGKETEFVQLISQLSGQRVSLFDDEGELIATSHQIEGGLFQLNNRPRSAVWNYLGRFADYFLGLLPGENVYSLHYYPYKPLKSADDHLDVAQALKQTLPSATAWRSYQNKVVLSVAVPVMNGELVEGVVLVESLGDSLHEGIKALRWDIFIAFLVAVFVTTLLSFYVSGTIAKPLRRLARAADQVRSSKKRNVELPDFSFRQDEISLLSSSLSDMTNALWNRMDAIESFAADVAHELKNPLTSLKSAVETVGRVNDPIKKGKLLEIVYHDIERLDRLISDISDASRLDAELSRGDMTCVNLTELLKGVEQLFARQKETHATCHLNIESSLNQAMVFGIESRLFQVFQNLIDNALSFSPKGEVVDITLLEQENGYQVHIKDQGPGIPSEAMDKIFQRFYTQRPEEEGFGHHSGLGLSIVKQIIESHDGTVKAENIYDRQGQVLGCEFIIFLPKWVHKDA